MREWVEGLYRSHGDAVFSFLRGMVHDRHVAEDLVQETFARALAAAGSFEARALPKTWLFAIARNLAINHLRRGARRQAVREGLSSGSLEGGSEPPEAAAMNENAASIREAVAALDAAHREVFLLKVIEGLTYREIAEIADCPVGTAQSRFHYAVRTLRKRLSRRGVEI